MSSPLEDPKKANKSKVWIVPVEITVMVDDPSLYDEQMEIFTKSILNELRGICTNFDKGRNQVFVKFLDPVKDSSKFESIRNGSASQDAEEKMEKMLEAILKKKGLA